MSVVRKFEQKRVALANGIELDVVDEGPRDGPVLMFLHGFPESHRTWRHQVAHFSDRFRCIAPDQRGYRGSSKPQDVESYTTDKLIGDIFLLADALGVGRFTIVGHDWGGAVAWGVAIGGQMSARVERCIIANGPHPAVFAELLLTNNAQREASQYMRGFRDPANDALVREHGLGALLEQETSWQRTDMMEPEERAALLEDWQDRDAAFAMLNWYRATTLAIPSLEEPYGLPEDWSPQPLPQLTIPTLVLWGMDDLALPPENLDGLEKHVSDLTLVQVPDVGHFLPWEAPEAVNAAMDDFLARTA